MNGVAVITGGSRGIGAACVEAFARAGWRTVFLCRKATDRAEALTAALREEGWDVAWFCCDVTDPAAVTETFAKIHSLYHRVDVLVNNAGISLIRMFQDTTEADWLHVFDVNLHGAYRCTRAVVEGMVHRGTGCIINISSMWGQVGASCEVAYSAAKAALQGMTMALAKELGPSGIRVNCVAPGVIDTEMNAELGEETKQSLAEETPLGRMGTPQDIADTVLYLASPAAGFITGQILGVNGGMVI